MISTTPSQRPDDLGSFLKTLRGRVDRHARVLGKHERLHRRLGRPVTQEELAEATGVSRVWYSMLESSAGMRPSASMLDRLATALQATPEERVTLFSLGMPELNPMLTPTATQGLDNLSVLNAASRRLWHASSESEVLTVVSEHLADWFKDSPLIVPAKRMGAGNWDYTIAVDRGAAEPWLECSQELRDSLTPTQVDDLASYPRLQVAGEIADEAALAHFSPDVWRLRKVIYDKNKLDLTSFLQARIATRRGLIGSVQVLNKSGRVYSELDRSAFGALAELASLALS